VASLPNWRIKARLATMTHVVNRSSEDFMHTKLAPDSGQLQTSSAAIPDLRGVPGKQTRASDLTARSEAPLQARATARAPQSDASPPPQMSDWVMTPELDSAMGLGLGEPSAGGAPVQRKEASARAGEGEAPKNGEEQAAEPAQGGGQPLSQHVRLKMESSLGADFSAVRIHEGPEAQAAGAIAYTRGTDIFFAPGQYQPESESGQELLGHELAHVVQQAQGRVQATKQAKGLAVNDDASLEREADELGAQAARGVRAASPQQGGLTSAATIQRRELPNDAQNITARDWTISDRENRTQRWKDACLHNLQAGDSGQYVRIIERRDFYEWFYQHTADLGYTTRWALAASVVATGAHEVADMNPGLESMGQITGTVSNELQGMMREGNQVIFDNVFPKLRALLRGGPLTGRAALQWDMHILSEEQALIQPLYMAVSASTRAQLDNIARQQGLPGAMATVMAPTVPSSTHVHGGGIPAFSGGALTSVEDRWRYGMNLGNQFTPGGSGYNPATDARPAPAAGYTDGSELARVQTRHNLHRLDAALDGGSAGAGWLTAEIESILRSLAGSELEELLRDRRPDGSRYSRRLMIPPATMFSLLATWRVGLEAQMNFLSGFIGGHNDGPWRDLNYSSLAPIIRPFSPEEKSRLHTSAWRRIFILVCDDSTIVDAVSDLGIPEPMRSQWIQKERSWF
jgi:Domain of unknown function (DUF4157)